MFCRQLFTVFFTFNQNLNLAILQNGIVNLFSLFDTGICGELGDYLGGVKDIITENTIEKWHDKGIFGRFFSRDHRCLLRNFFG